MEAKTTKVNFEKSLQELDSIVEQMEKDDLGLEKSLKLFEKGITLVHKCQGALKKAEQKIEILCKKGAQETLEPFEGETE